MLDDILDNFSHPSGKTLNKHLEGTADILRQWGCSNDLINVGRYHSVYGTSGYKNIATTNRQEIVELIGEYAESLVYAFCSATDLTKMREFIKDKNTELIIVECANLIELKTNQIYTLDAAMPYVPGHIAKEIHSYIMAQF